MTAPFLARAAQSCIEAAVGDVLARCQPEDCARWLHCSADTVSRMIRGEHPAALTVARLCDLAAYERSALGTDRLGAALVEAFAPTKLRPAVGPIEGSVAQTLPQILGLAHHASAALASDARLDAREAAELIPDVERSLSALHTLLLGLVAEVRRGAR